MAAILTSSFCFLFLLRFDTLCFFFFFLMIRRPPRSTLFPTRRSSDLPRHTGVREEQLLPVDLVVRDRLLSVGRDEDRKSTRLNSSHPSISYAVFCLKKKKKTKMQMILTIKTLSHYM